MTSHLKNLFNKIIIVWHSEVSLTQWQIIFGWWRRNIVWPYKMRKCVEILLGWCGRNIVWPYMEVCAPKQATTVHPLGAKSSHTPPPLATPSPLATPLATPSPPICPTSSPHFYLILIVWKTRFDQLDMYMHVYIEVVSTLESWQVPSAAVSVRIIFVEKLFSFQKPCSLDSFAWKGKSSTLWNQMHKHEKVVTQPTIQIRSAGWRLART